MACAACVACIPSWIRSGIECLDAERDRKRTEQSFFVPKEEIVGNDYDLSINKYRQTEYRAVEYPPTSEIMAKLDELEREIGAEMDALRELLGL